MPTHANIRPANPSDISFIYSTWLKSFKYDSILGKSLRSSVFFTNYREVIDYILEDDDTEVNILYTPENENVILGYIVYTQKNYFLHYVYVKEDFRQFGVARQLLKSCLFDSEVIEYTHLTFTAQKILQNQSGFVYNPFNLYKR